MAQISGTITQAGQSLNGTVRASGRGIASVDINDDGYLVVTYTDGEVWTSDEVIIGNGIESIEHTSTSGAVKTYTITFTDGTTTTFDVTDGEVTNASLALITGDLTDLDTTDKTSIVSAMNEVNGKAEDADAKADTVDGHVGNLSELDTEDKTSAVDAINEVLSKIPVMTKEVTGNPIVVDDALNADVVSLDVDLEPVQDLNGYDKPWAGGAGKNKLPNFTVSDFDNGQVYGNSTYIRITLKAGTYTMSTDAPATYLWVGSVINWPSDYSRVTSGTPKTITLASDGDIAFGILTTDKATALSYKTQLELGSTATTYEPYSNICPITGHDSVTVTDTGINQWDEQWEEGSFDVNTGEKQSVAAYWRSKNIIPVMPSQTYYFLTSSDSIWRFMYDRNMQYVGYLSGINNASWQVPANVYYINIVDVTRNVYDPTAKPVSINYPSTDTSYHAYHGQSTTVTLPHTVYGGDVDVTGGTGTEKMAIVDLGTLNWVKSTNMFISTGIATTVKPPTSGSTTGEMSICSAYGAITVSEAYAGTKNGYAIVHAADASAGNLWISDNSLISGTAAEFKTAMSGVYLCYELATPTDLTTTPTDITLYNGDNTVTADGDMDMVYVRDIVKVIEKLEG